MADGRYPIGGTFEDVGEAVVKPVSDEVGKALEQGVQVVSGTGQQVSQANVQAKQIETRTRLAEARRKIKWWKDLEEAQKRVREGLKQKSFDSAQDRQKQQEIQQFEVSKKQQKNVTLERQKTKTEIKGGVGG